MNIEDIIRMADKAGIVVTGEAVWKLCELVAAAEREACAKEAEDSDHVVLGRSYHDQLGDADATARNIAAAIRARGQA